MKRLLFILLQCTWGLGATLIGFIVFLVYIRSPHRMFHGVIDTRWDKARRGLGLGLFIFTPGEDSAYSKEIRVHEFGHAVQSIVLGPLMLIPGLISVIWNRLPYFEKLREKKHIPYTSCFVESWASRLGEHFTGEKAIWD